MRRSADFEETGLNGTSGTIYALLWRCRTDLGIPALISWLLLLALKVGDSILQFPGSPAALSRLGKALLLIAMGLTELALPMLLYVAILIPLVGGRQVARLNPIGKPDKLGRLVLAALRKYLTLMLLFIPLFLAYVFKTILGNAFNGVVLLLLLPAVIAALYLLYRLMFVLPAVVHAEAEPIRFSWNATRGEVGGLFLASLAAGLPVGIPRGVIAFVAGPEALEQAALRADLHAVLIYASINTLLTTATMVLSALTVGVCYNVLVRGIALPDQRLGVGRA